jgi:hypothetical protein
LLKKVKEWVIEQKKGNSRRKSELASQQYRAHGEFIEKLRPFQF